MISGAAPSRYNPFDLIYAIAKVFDFEAKNVIVLFSEILTRGTSWFESNFRSYFFSRQKVEQRCH